MAKIKNLYRGAFNYRNSVNVLYAYAFSPEQARVIMCRRLAKRHGVHPAVVLSLFGDGENYEITVELEIKEESA